MTIFISDYHDLKTVVIGADADSAERNTTLTDEILFGFYPTPQITFGHEYTYTLIQPMRMTSLYMQIESIENRNPFTRVEVYGHGNTCLSIILVCFISSLFVFQFAYCV